MNDRLIMGRYYPGHSLLHRLDPRTKFSLMILMMVTILIPRTPLPLALLALGSVILALISQVPPGEILKSLRPILWVILFAFLINLFTGGGETIVRFWIFRITREGASNAILMSLRLLLLVMDTTILLTLTTTPIQLADALEKLLNPLKVVKFPAHEIAMMMSIALRFVPTLLEETDKIMKAQSSRGADYDTGGLIRKAKGFVSILIPLFISAFRRANDLAYAMEARCYRGGEGRTKLHSLQYSRLDAIFSIVFSLVCALVLFAHYFLDKYLTELF